MIKAWNYGTDKYMQDNISTQTPAEMARHFTKTENAVRQRLRKIGLIEVADKGIPQVTKQGIERTAEHIAFEHWLRSRPCQVPDCGKMAECAHHSPFKSQGGTNDRQVGLCTPHHVDSKVGIHGLGNDLLFEAMHGIYLPAIAEQNFIEFRELDK